MVLHYRQFCDVHISIYTYIEIQKAALLKSVIICYLWSISICNFDINL